MAQNEVPFDFLIFTYIIAVNLGQLWEIFRCFREPTASRDTENMPRGCNKLFGSYPEGFGWNPWHRTKLGPSFHFSPILQYRAGPNIGQNRFLAIWGTKKIAKFFCVFFRSCGRYKLSIKKNFRSVAFFPDFISLWNHIYIYIIFPTYIHYSRILFVLGRAAKPNRFFWKRRRRKFWKIGEKSRFLVDFRNDFSRKIICRPHPYSRRFSKI